MSFVNISAAVLGLVLVFGGPLGFLIRMAVSGNNADSFMHILIRRILINRALDGGEMLYETPGKAVSEKAVSENTVSGNTGSGKSVSENKNGHLSERRVS